MGDLWKIPFEISIDDLEKFEAKSSSSYRNRFSDSAPYLS
jgi:hypothetical protein